MKKLKDDFDKVDVAFMVVVLTIILSSIIYIGTIA